MVQVTNYALTAGLSGVLTRQQIAAVLAAGQSLNSGATAPQNPVAGMLWLDSSTTPWTPRIRNDANTAWVVFVPADGAITNAKLASVATGIIKGRAAAGSGAVEDLSPAQALSLMGITATAAQINPLGDAFDNAFLGAGITSNLAIGANDFGNNARWINTQTANGVTVTRVGFGIDANGCTYVEYSVVGTPTTGSHTIDAYVQQSSVTAATSGQVFTASYYAQIVGGTTPTDANTGVRIDMRGQTSLGVQTEAFFTDVTRPTAQTLRTLTATLANATTTQIVCQVVLRVQAGVSANFTVRISGLQFDRGAARLAYPFKALSAAEALIALGVATQAEAEAGLVDTKIMTPLKVKQYVVLGFAASFATNGYIKLPNWLGGLIIQWGYDAGNAADHNVTFPIAFPTAKYGVFLQPLNLSALAAGESLAFVVGNVASLTFFSLHPRFTNNGGGVGVAVQPSYWLALGK